MKKITKTNLPKKRHSFNELLFKLITITLLLFLNISLGQVQGPLVGAELQSKEDVTYGRIEFKMFSEWVSGTTSTYFWWQDGGQECYGERWNEIDIETIPADNGYQSNPIWQEYVGDPGNRNCKWMSEEIHGTRETIYGRWVSYALEWTPDYIAWYHDGQLDRRINATDAGINGNAVRNINMAMRYCFNLWARDDAGWLGALASNTFDNGPVYQFVDDFKLYDYNSSTGGFESTPRVDVDFSSDAQVAQYWNKSTWSMSQAIPTLNWSPDASGVVNQSNGNGILWMCLAPQGQQRPPLASEIPSEDGGTTNPPTNDNTVAFNPPATVEAGEIYAITVDYSSSQQNDVRLTFFADGWVVLDQQVVTVPAGTGTLSFDVTIPADELGTGYIWQTDILPVGATYLDRYAVADLQNVEITAPVQTFDNTVAFNPPATLEAGETYTINVDYSSAQQNDVRLTFFADGWAVLDQQVVTVPAGTGTLSFDVTIPADELGTTYIWQTDILPVGATWESRYALDEIQNVTVTNTPAPPTYDNTVAFNPPATLEAGETYTINVDYSSAQQNDVRLTFFADGWAVLDQQVVTVPAGTGTLSFDVTIPADELGTGYIWQTDILPVGATYLDRYAVADVQNVEITSTITPPSSNAINLPGVFEAENYVTTTNTDVTLMLVQTADGGYKMGYNDAGDSYTYNVNVSESGSYQFDFRVSNGSATIGQLQVISNGVSIGTVNIPTTGGWEVFQNVTLEGELFSGEQTLELVVLSAGVDINWVDVTEVIVTQPTLAIGFTEPTATTFNEGDPISVTVVPSNGELINVSLTLNGAALRTDNDVPHTWGTADNALQNLPAGNYTLVATATLDNNTSVSATATYNFTVESTIVTPPTTGCDFGTPLSTALPSINTSYNNMHVLGSGGPDLSNVTMFTINWDLPNRGLYQFSINTNNGNPNWYVDLRSSMAFTFDAENPSLTFTNTNIIGLDGDYWVTTDDGNFVMVSKTGGFTIYMSNSATEPVCTSLSGLTAKTLSLKDAIYQEDVRIFPVPTKNMLTIKGISNYTNVQIINTVGQSVLSVSTKGFDVLDLNVSAIPSGIYFVKVIGKENVFTRKIAKE